MLMFKVLSRCSEPVKFAFFYVVTELMKFGRDMARLIGYGLGCMALGVILFMLRYYMSFYESNVNA